MDIDCLTSRFHSARHLSAAQASRLNSDSNLIVDDLEGDDDSKASFPCPFCYVDIEVHVFCSHLQEEHCFDLKNAVCPLCAANLGKDALEHFIVLHASLLKRRKKFPKSGFWSGSSAAFGRESSSFIGSSTIGGGNVHDPAPDPFLSPFLNNAPVSNGKRKQQVDVFSEVSVASDLKSEPTLLDEGHEEVIEERRKRATFIQQLIMSTMF